MQEKNEKKTSRVINLMASELGIAVMNLTSAAGKLSELCSQYAAVMPAQAQEKDKEIASLKEEIELLKKQLQRLKSGSPTMTTQNKVLDALAEEERKNATKAAMGIKPKKPLKRVDTK